MSIRAIEEVSGKPSSDSPAASVADFCACPDDGSDLERSGDRLRCTGCGREFEVRGRIPILLPATHDAIEDRYFANYESIATADLEKPFEGNRPARHHELRHFIGEVAGLRVLDIGSSDAMYLREMDASVKVALDIAFEYLAHVPEESRIMCICGDAEHLPIKAGYFDVVIISDVLEHVLHADRVVRHLQRICRPDTRLIVHVPWEEDLSQYRDVPYEFTHLRSFDAFSFQTLFHAFYERRSRATYPRIVPLPYPLYGRLPRPLYNLARFALSTRWAGPVNRMTERWNTELPRREWWLLRVYKPIFRMFELRLVTGTTRYRLYQWMRSKRRSRPA